VTIWIIGVDLRSPSRYVTGGFRTLSGMTRALEANAYDSVETGRPLSAEPYLCKEILEGRVTGALRIWFCCRKICRRVGVSCVSWAGSQQLGPWVTLEEGEGP
jgi:2,4-dienoyl-CoA reductase-like NADH-dependent reductase (Old Yellow Enzyme family)